MTTEVNDRVRFSVPCPGCMTGQPMIDGGPETCHIRCSGCGKLLIIVWTDNALFVTFSEWAGQENHEGWGLAPARPPMPQPPPPPAGI
jgi:hypothetical protein